MKLRFPLLLLSLGAVAYAVNLSMKTNPPSAKDALECQPGEKSACGLPSNVVIDMSKVDYLEGPAGSVTIHNCRTLHYSKANWSEIPRPLLLNVYSAANAMPYTYNPLQSKYYGAIVRGKPARWAYHDPRPCLLPPDWSGGYTSIFAVQQEEKWDKDRPKVAAGGMM